MPKKITVDRRIFVLTDKSKSPIKKSSTPPRGGCFPARGYTRGNSAKDCLGPTVFSHRKIAFVEVAMGQKGKMRNLKWVFKFASILKINQNFFFFGRIARCH